MRRMAILGAAVAIGLGVLTTASTAQVPQTPDGWTGTWSASPGTGVADTPGGYPDYSIRNVVHTSAGGAKARVRLSNRFGTAPLIFGHVTVAVAAAPGSPRAASGTVRSLTFGGQRSVVVPAGADVLSDPAAVRVPADADLLVTTFVPAKSGPVTYHAAAEQTSFFTRDGDFTAEESGASFTEKTGAWHYVTEVDVQGAAAGAVVTLGDSITDGTGSTPGTDHRWPDLLSDRLHGRYGVLNAGIGGNRMLLDVPGSPYGPNALARFDHDVLAATGVRTLIILEGINDIQQQPNQTDPQLLISAQRQLIARAKAHGIRVLGATLVPFKGWAAYNETLENTRETLNRFIRTGGAYDGVIDFDAAIRNPADPHAMLPAYDAGDHLHPNDAGYRRMADSVNLGLL
ncbi:SGNH/GDSL hydrolase family protein [Amycolatopsis panacis]|uniref:SGNH/GDSL hydrolase family protein n=1 Tax=Amycolatopsis panacis TaxID=2340917 RepID=A0A419I7H3_9PSEU|nr:SGNH/GDSL hydrolase family protein [Amycolatopsis panacis]RJQ87832.1 SGNH/GDSL hydrolase family protein [Amycolatopsis panacis]